MINKNKIKLSKWIVIPIAAIAIIAFSGKLRNTPSPSPIIVPPSDDASVLISKDEAIAKIKSLPKVIEYLKTVPRAVIEIDSEEDDSYSIHVYEVKDNHTATFNWFTVDKKTGVIKEMF